MAKNIQFTFLLLTIVATLLVGSLAGTVLKLVNKYHVNGPKTRSELLTQMLQRDNSNGAGTAPLVAGRYNGSVTGHYFAKIKMGTPAQELLMDIDTGSDITWMNCFYKGKQLEQNATGSIFNADNSTSFSEIQCGSSTCQDIPNSNWCGSPSFGGRRTSGQNTSCGLFFSYRGESVRLVLANDTVTFDLTNGTKTQLRDVLVGCSDYSSDIDGAIGGASGVLGLRNNSLSLRSKASESLGTNLSYCFLDPLTPINTSSYLIFGSHEDVDIPFDQEMQYTELVPAGDDGSYYGLNIKDVCVNRECNILMNLSTKPLEFNSKGNGGVVVDTGSLVTLLVEEAYTPIIRAINTSFVGFNISI
ncbi:hypothetical protein CASFOL_040557 [Castilleja foliolosa]|uniref:Peptidase A1 domain-containing protein n=1 Tax=Castilleja foliolosa TaxID=1961234 RepID=A0ABD3BCU8_9LAMI